MLPPPWRPDRYARRRPHLLRRAAITAAVRTSFAARGFIEVETPALQISPGMEVHLNGFRTRLDPPGGGVGVERWLHTSPEFAMKKLLVAGEQKIFQLARVFRNNEGSDTHSPEFTMLEWYRAGGGLDELIDDCRALVAATARAAGTTIFRHKGQVCDIAADWEILTVAEAFTRHVGCDVLASLDAPTILVEACRRHNLVPRAEDDWETLFFRLTVNQIEPHLGQGRPTVLTGWPAPLAALSRLDPADPRCALRFELYIAGVELANAFAELTDPVEQRRRFDQDQARKQALYGHAFPIDADFIAALAHGMPDAAGIALGVDRLVMLACGVDDIEDVLWLPVR